MAELPDLSQVDAIVLAGGDSRRMGTAKATLAFGDTSLVDTVVAKLRPVFRNVFVVTRDKDLLAGLGVEVLEDTHSLQGPLVGVARGLSHSNAPWCIVAACDMPIIQVEVIKKMAIQAVNSEAVIPIYDGRLQTLHAFYSSACLLVAQDLLEHGITSMKALAERCLVTELPEDHFALIPCGLKSFRDLDTIQDYDDALKAIDPPP